MAGTGRLSLPLVEAGVRLSCVDLSAPMLARLNAKLAARGLRAPTYVQDVRALDLPDRNFALALLPFQSFGNCLQPTTSVPPWRASMHILRRAGGSSAPCTIRPSAGVRSTVSSICSASCRCRIATAH